MKSRKSLLLVSYINKCQFVAKSFSGKAFALNNGYLTLLSTLLLTVMLVIEKESFYTRQTEDQRAVNVCDLKPQAKPLVNIVSGSLQETIYSGQLPKFNNCDQRSNASLLCCKPLTLLRAPRMHSRIATTVVIAVTICSTFVIIAGEWLKLGL